MSAMEMQSCFVLRVGPGRSNAEEYLLLREGKLVLRDLSSPVPFGRMKTCSQSGRIAPRPAFLIKDKLRAACSHHLVVILAIFPIKNLVCIGWLAHGLFRSGKTTLRSLGFEFCLNPLSSDALN